jgi:hypothetical protein
MKRIFKNQLVMIFFFYIAIVALLYSNFGFYSFAEYKPRPEFWDLNNAPMWWDCYKNVGLNVFLSTESPLDVCRNFNYGYFSMVSMGLTTSLYSGVKFWGFLQIIVFVFLLVKIYFCDVLKHQKYIFLLALFSPGLFLLYTSGNMDMQIICALLIANRLIVSGKEKRGLTLICITALLKFYTAPILLITTLIVKRKNSRAYGSMLIFCTASIILYQLIKTPPTAFPDGAQNKFGSGIFDNYARKAGIDMSKFQGELLGLLFLFVALFLIIFCYYKYTPLKDNTSLKLSKLQHMLALNYLMMAGTSIACYLGGLNVDYRLTFIALAGIALFQIPHTRVKFVSALYPYFWMLSLWIAYPFANFKKFIGLDLQPLGDIFMISTIAYFIFQGFFLFKLLVSSNKASL